jgi:fatty acid desaturase
MDGGVRGRNNASPERETMMEPEASLKARVQADLPPQAFSRKPLWSLLVVPLVGLIVAASVVLATLPLPWYAAVPASILLGLLYASLTFLGHEIAHGVSIGPGPLRTAITYLSFAIYCISPHLWLVWHHQAHHAHTNVAGRDPDNFGTLEEFRRDALWCRLMVKYLPGFSHGHSLSVIYLGLFFTLQGQGMLWSKSRRLPDFRALRRRRAILDTVLLAAFWVGVGVLAGPTGALLIVVIPMFVANIVVSSYILTTHMLCPMTTRPDTLATTMSVRTYRIIDILQFHFSHHIEHHLFPAMCSRYYPLVRQSLRRHLGDRYLAPPHWRALLSIVRTPRVYDGFQALIDPFTDRRIQVEDVLAALRRSGVPEAEVKPLS